MHFGFLNRYFLIFFMPLMLFFWLANITFYIVNWFPLFSLPSSITSCHLQWSCWTLIIPLLHLLLFPTVRIIFIHPFSAVFLHPLAFDNKHSTIFSCLLSLYQQKQSRFWFSIKDLNKTHHQEVTCYSGT